MVRSGFLFPFLYILPKRQLRTISGPDDQLGKAQSMAAGSRIRLYMESRMGTVPFGTAHLGPQRLVDRLVRRRERVNQKRLQWSARTAIEHKTIRGIIVVDDKRTTRMIGGTARGGIAVFDLQATIVAIRTGSTDTEAQGDDPHAQERSGSGHRWMIGKVCLQFFSRRQFAQRTSNLSRKAASRKSDLKSCSTSTPPAHPLPTPAPRGFLPLTPRRKSVSAHRASAYVHMSFA